MKRLVLVVLAAVMPLSVGLSVGAATKPAHPTYALGAAKKCRTDYVKKTETRVVKVKGKNVSQRYVACVYRAPRPISPVPKPVAVVTTTPTTTASPTTGPTVTTIAPVTTPTTTPGSSTPPSGGGSSGGGTPAPPAPPSAPPVLGVSLDPSFVQSPDSPLDVTYTFSASASVNGAPDQVLPSGVLDFYSDGTLACSINVGGPTTGGQCLVVYTVLGSHNVITEYLSGGQTATTGAEIVHIPAFPSTVTIGTVAIGATVDMSNLAYSQVNIPVTVSGITTSLGTSGTVSLTNLDASVEQCGMLSNHPSLGTATTTCSADIENDPDVATQWTPIVRFTGDANFTAATSSARATTIPAAPAPSETDITTTLTCAESGGFCSEYDSNAETTGADANVAIPGNQSPQVGTVTFTSSDHILICTAVVFSAANLPSNNARCTGQGGPFSGPLTVEYSGGTVLVGDISKIVYSSAIAHGGSN